MTIKNICVLLTAIVYNFSVLHATNLSSVHIVALENGELVKHTPFASRVNFFGETITEEDIEFKDHGVYVSSVLVGDRSSLPPQTNITLIPNIDSLVPYLQKQKQDDLVIFNWSGSIGSPGLSEDNLDEFNNLQSYFQKILFIDSIEFEQCVKEYITNFDQIIQQLNHCPDNHLTPVIKFAKECLETAQDKPTILQSNKNKWLSEFKKGLDSLKEEGDRKSYESFNQMKKAVLESLKQHDNTLIIWALGNEGRNCDNSPFWQELLKDDLILSHVILVYGHDALLQKNSHINSNYTIKYKNHALAKPYRTFVWDNDRQKYTLFNGTSFSAPLLTIDAFRKAQEIIDKTGKQVFYSTLKEELLKARGYS